VEEEMIKKFDRCQQEPMFENSELLLIRMENAEKIEAPWSGVMHLWPSIANSSDVETLREGSAVSYCRSLPAKAGNF
jgi:hypothetical protein